MQLKNKITTMYDINPTITFGKYHGKKASDIPVEYLIKLKNDFGDLEKCPDPSFIKWVKENIGRIKFQNIPIEKETIDILIKTMPHKVTSRLTMGKYKRKQINDIPIEYLLRLAINLKVCFDSSLAKFIEENLAVLKSAVSEGKTHVHQITSLQPVKQKIPVARTVPSPRKAVIDYKKTIKYEVANDYKTKKKTTKNFSEVKCTSGKKSYNSQNDAAQAIKTILKNSSKDKVPKREYYCDECRKWHLTSHTNKKPKSSH